MRMKAPGLYILPRVVGKKIFNLAGKKSSTHRPLDEEGNFLSGFGALGGKFAGDPETTDWIVETSNKRALTGLRTVPP